jgi:hypothetical protein
MSNGVSSLAQPRPHVPVAMRSEHVLRVTHRNLRWEVAHNGLIRPMIDWLCTRERAVDHAVEIAERLLAYPGRERVLLVIEGVEHVLRHDNLGTTATH